MDIRFIIAIVMLSIATINDYKERKVKNIIPAIMIVLGIIANMFFYQDVNLLHSLLISFLYFFSLFFIPRLFHINEFMGAGDIKLLMATSFLLGWKFSLYTFLYSVIIGSIILVILNLRRIREIGLNIAMFFISKGKWLIDESQNKTNMFTTYILIGCILEFFIQYDWLFLHILNF
jgi:prepilin peptidase CpaA